MTKNCIKEHGFFSGFENHSRLYSGILFGVYQSVKHPASVLGSAQGVMKELDYME